MEKKPANPVLNPAPAGSADAYAATPDLELIAAALQGVEAAFEGLVQRYQRGIVNYIYRMAGNYETALELAQETFLKVYLSLKEYNSEYKFSTWIYRIAHNQTVDLLRRKRPRAIPIDAPIETEEGPQPRQFATKDPSALETMIESEEWARIAGAIAALPEGLRELIVLRHVNLRSYEEIARITGLPLGTVKNRIFLGRGELRRLLTGDAELPESKAPAAVRQPESAATPVKTATAGKNAGTAARRPGKKPGAPVIAKNRQKLNITKTAKKPRPNPARKPR
jgi:RNA polymerase sigma-70 factor (ECF subfamily)